MAAIGRFCCRSRLLATGGGYLVMSGRLCSAGADALYATPTLRDAHSLSGWWPRDQLCKASQILSDGGQNKLVLGASWTTQSKSTELKDGLQVRKSHLDLLALTSRLLKAIGASE